MGGLILSEGVLMLGKGLSYECINCGSLFKIEKIIVQKLHLYILKYYMLDWIG